MLSEVQRWSAARLRGAVARTLLATGAEARGRRRQGARLRILMYHGVVARRTGPGRCGNLFVDQKAFARHARSLARDFCVVSLEQVAESVQAGRPFPDRAVWITFDDGYRNVVTTALPVLQVLRLPATVFVLPGLMDAGEGLWFDALRVLLVDGVEASEDVGHGLTLGRPSADPERAWTEAVRRILRLDPRLQREMAAQILALGRREQWLPRHPGFALAGWDEWRRACSDGLISVGSHGMRHETLAGLSREACMEEWQRSKSRIEDALGRTCLAAAYPYGALDASAAEAARQAGYACAVTTDEGLNEAQHDPMRLRRTMIGDGGDVALFRARASGAWDLARPRGSR